MSLFVNDSVCELYMSLAALCRRALKHTNHRLQICAGDTKLPLPNLRHPNHKGNQGKMTISMEIMYPAGLGRGDPNQNPFLPQPEGRMVWSFNPFFMLKQLLGSKLYYKVSHSSPCSASPASLPCCVSDFRWSVLSSLHRSDYLDVADYFWKHHHKGHLWIIIRALLIILLFHSPLFLPPIDSLNHSSTSHMKAA